MCVRVPACRSLAFPLFHVLAYLQNTVPLICISLNKNGVCSILTRSSENAAKFKQ